MCSDEWYMIKHNPVQFVQNNLNEINIILGKLLDDPTFGDDIAIFVWNSYQLPNQVWLFPPKTVKLTKNILLQFGAEPCDEPAQEDVAMLLGNEQVFDSFFSV